MVLCAFLFGLHKLDDFDTWWHLAAGRWIVTHGSIPTTDTLSHTVAGHEWINLQWGFDVLLYGLYQLGGPALLTVMGAVVFAVTVALVLRLAHHSAAGWPAAALTLVAVVAAQERVTLRPELGSFLLLALVLTVLDHGRRHAGRGLFLLVPLMIVWANVHALFVVGAGVIGCALVGTGRRPTQPLLRWGGLALAATVINPWGLQGLWLPLELLTRLDGSHAVFGTIGEFVSPFAPGSWGAAMSAYKVLLAVGVVAGLAVLLGFRRAVPLDWGQLLLFAGLAALSISARRNVALFAIGAIPIVAAWITPMRNRSAGASAVVLATAVILGATVVTGAFHRFENAPQEFGTGVIEGAFPERAAAFARAAALPPRLYNDMAAGGYLAWDDPTSAGVFVDGRLEVYDADFLTDYVAGTSDVQRWQAQADRHDVQTAIIFHRFENERRLIGLLTQSPAWTRVYVDEVAVIFVRTSGHDAAIARAAALRPDWDARTQAWLSRPTDGWRHPAGRIEGTRAYARALATLGQGDAAVAAYEVLFALGISRREELELRGLVSRYLAGRGRLDDAKRHARRIVDLDPGNLDARALLVR